MGSRYRWRQDPNPAARAVISLHSEEEYEALSYTWDAPWHGQDLAVGTLYISDTPFRITGNLAGALKQLRPRRTIRALWVDAVCINQQDNVERAHHVHIMASIYARAKRVIAWLGDESEHVSYAFALAASASEQNQYTYIHGVGERRAKARRRRERRLLNVVEHLLKALEQKHDDDIQAQADEVERLWQSVTSRRYFERRWVLQELAWATGITFVCGLDSISYHELIKYITGNHWTTMTDGFQCSNLVRFFEKLQSTRENLRSQSILDLLYTFQAWRCADDRDRIAALMGLFKGSIGNFTMNYDISCEALYTNFTVSLIDARSLELDYVPHIVQAAAFQAAERQQTATNLPSWVPDWRMKVPKPAEHFRWCQGTFEASAIGILDAYLPVYGTVGHNLYICGPMWSDFEIEDENMEILCLVLRAVDDGECHVIAGACPVFPEGMLPAPDHSVKQFWIL
ncbi:hypothetical protein AC579_9100 [Pseudocercospora musae]|uniref:Heterokaryon incompatibility domain-containing protein n=1 Tax=Pseudocercospora musae TaxID=113226 RepID=A0A139IIL5_9PEZI|nr:hypothetical protein AC579_9100 [Pseudocercospora musae]